jgi:SAM-dependent methyltransferase
MTEVPCNIEYTTPAIEAFYREHRIRWDQFYDSERVVLTELAPSAATSVLDVGCGCGGLGLALRDAFGVTDYTGVEINRQAAATARAMNPAGRFICADMLSVTAQQLADESFDLVVSLSCIDWNLQFAAMLARAYRHVKPGGQLVASLRLTARESLLDIGRSYQYINFDGRRDGELAPYVVLNVRDLLRDLLALAPERVRGYGYWGAPSVTAVTPLAQIGFAVFALRKGVRVSASTRVELDLPTELMRAAFRD